MNESPNASGAESSSPVSSPMSADVVTELRTLLGQDAVLLHIAPGKKVPTSTGWQLTTVADMERGDYLMTLRHGNIGVLLGEASGGLCAIDIDDDDAVEPFLELNPHLRHTLRSKGFRGQQIWVRVATEYPALTKIVTTTAEPWGEWRATGGQSVIHGAHPERVAYHFVNRAAPIEITFDQINWPDNLQLPWLTEPDDDLAALAGAPYVVGDNGSIQLNHMFWVRRYMAEHTIVFDSSLGDFYEYEATTGLWRKLTQETIKRRFMNDLAETARAAHLEGLHRKLTEGLGVSLVGLLRTMAERADVFANRPAAIHVKNGMLCREGDSLVLREFSPDFYSRNACPFEYREDAECPRFREELLGAALNDDDIALIQKWSGACLLGRNATQRFLLMMGTPGGGKGTFMNILEHVIGIQNVVQLRTNQLGSRFELFGFVGKTLLSGKDVAADFLLDKNANVIKALVGHDLLSAEKKGHAEPIPLRGDFNLGITCNADLNIRLEGDLGAWRRRMMIIRYDRPAPLRRIDDFDSRLLQEEGPGILRWMVEGAMMLLDDISEVGNYRLTPAQIARVDGLLAQSESVRLFVENCVMAEPNGEITTEELRRAYYDYCEGQGWNTLPEGEAPKVLQNAMLDVHHARFRHDVGINGTRRGYRGVRLQQRDQRDAH
jgi:P4 family phage/plasmid primase-like protien